MILHTSCCCQKSLKTFHGVVLYIGFNNIMTTITHIKHVDLHGLETKQDLLTLQVNTFMHTQLLGKHKGYEAYALHAGSVTQ